MSSCRSVLPLFFLGLLAAASSAEVPFEDCGSRFLLLSVDIEGCDMRTCSMIIGDRVNVTMRFRSQDTEAKQLRAEVKFKINDINHDLEVMPSNCAALLSTTCPVPEDEIVTYQAELIVDNRFFESQGDMQWSIFSETNARLVCMRTAIALFEPPVPYY